jgi:hypothetical protein
MNDQQFEKFLSLFVDFVEAHKSLAMSMEDISEELKKFNHALDDYPFKILITNLRHGEEIPLLYKKYEG